MIYLTGSILHLVTPDDNSPPFTLPEQTGQTPLSIAQRLGYISVVEVLKHITEVTPQQAPPEEKYKVVSPETMQETLMTDSEDEGGKDLVSSHPPPRPNPRSSHRVVVYMRIGYT